MGKSTGLKSQERSGFKSEPLTAYIFGQVPNLIESPIPQLDMEMAGPAMQGGCGDHTGLQGKCPAQHLACSGRKVLS